MQPSWKRIPINSKAVGQDLAYYQRLPDGHEQKTYEYLINALERHLDRTQMEANQGLRRNLLLKGRGLAPGAAAGGGASTTTTGAPKKPCYFFNHGSCKNTDANCRFAHVQVSAEEKAKMEKPQRSGSPARSPRGPPSSTNTTTTTGTKLHCFKFLKGNCTNGDDCAFAHLSQEAVKEVARAKAKAKGKAKAQPKAAAKSSGLAVPLNDTTA